MRGHAPAAAQSPSTAPQCVAWPHPARRPAAHRPAPADPTRDRPAHGPSTPPGDRPPNRLLARPHQATRRAAAATPPRPVSGLRSTAGRVPRPPTQPPRRHSSLLSPRTISPTPLDIGFSPNQCPRKLGALYIGFSLNPCPRKLGAPHALVQVRDNADALGDFATLIACVFPSHSCIMVAADAHNDGATRRAFKDQCGALRTALSAVGVALEEPVFTATGSVMFARLTTE